MLKELIRKNRTYRRYKEEEPVSIEVLKELIDAARISSCGNNMQALKYIVSNQKEMNESIFSSIKWAASLGNWDGPEEGERPSAYIVILLDKNIRSNPLWDHGIAAANILLCATECGYGGCMFASFNKEALVQLLELPQHLEPLIVISLGVVKEAVVLEEMKDGKYKYYRDERGVHHVPKRSLEEVLYKEFV